MAPIRLSPLRTQSLASATGSGTGPSSVTFTLGITKAYTTRVGSGPFPTEDFGTDGERMGERGREFGTVTGRKRRCGWFDAVMVRQAGLTAGITGMALTKLMLDGFDVLKICIGYDCRDESWIIFRPMPPTANAHHLRRNARLACKHL